MDEKDTQGFEYAAFISFANEDLRLAKRIHKALESYVIPKSVGSVKITKDPRSQQRLYPCFFAPEELGSSSLPQQLKEALRGSRALVVLSSSSSVGSNWVNAEISEFLLHHNVGSVVPVLIDDATLLEDSFDAIIPDALKDAYREKTASSRPFDTVQVLSADLRHGRDGFSLGILKIVAGVSRVKLRDLANRELQRWRNRRLALSFLAALAVSVGSAIVGERTEQIAFQDMTSRLTRAVDTQEAFYSLAMIVQNGSAEQSMKALLALPKGCPGVDYICVLYDENYGTIYSNEVSVDEYTVDEDRKFIFHQVNSKIASRMKLQTKLFGGGVAKLPPSITRTYGQYGEASGKSGRRFRYNFRSVRSDPGFGQVVYAVIPYDFVDGFREGYRLKIIVPGLALLAFLAHGAIEFYKESRLLSRPKIPKDKKTTAAYRSRWRGTKSQRH